MHLKKKKKRVKVFLTIAISIILFSQVDVIWQTCLNAIKWQSKFKNWLTCLHDFFFFNNQKLVERKSVKLLYSTLGGKTLISLKKLRRLEYLLDFRHQWELFVSILTSKITSFNTVLNFSQNFCLKTSIDMFLIILQEYTKTLQRLSEASILDLFQWKYAHSWWEYVRNS